MAARLFPVTLYFECVRASGDIRNLIMERCLNTALTHQLGTYRSFYAYCNATDVTCMVSPGLP